MFSRAELTGPERNCTLIWGKWEGSWTLMVRQKSTDQSCQGKGIFWRCSFLPANFLDLVLS